MPNPIDQIAEAMNAELRARPQQADMHTPATTPIVVLQTLARMGYHPHKYPAPDVPGRVGPDDPQWSLDVGTLQLIPDGDTPIIELDGDWVGYQGTTIDEYRQLAEGILAACELAETLAHTESKDPDHA